MMLGNRRVSFHASESARLAMAVVMSFAVVFVAPANGANEALTLREAEQLALRQEPGQAAYLAKARAFEDKAVAAGQLPDPKIRLGLANYPIQSGDFSSEAMTQAQVGIGQTFPPGHTRAASSRQFRSLAAAMTENADARGRDVLTLVRDAWLETYYWERAQQILGDIRPLFVDLDAVVRSLYAVGRKDQQDVLGAELALSRLDDRLLEADRGLRRGRAELSQWTGDAASQRPLPQVLPEFETAPDLSALRQALREHPALRAAEARSAAGRAAVDLALQRYKPGWALDLSYGYRQGELADGRSRPDFFSLSVTMDLPLFRVNRQDREVAAARSESTAADESQEELTRRLSSQLDAEYARWQTLTRRIELYEQEILPQADARARAALNAYRSATGDFADVVRAYIDLLDARLEHVRLKVDRAQSLAVLANLGGLEP